MTPFPPSPPDSTSVLQAVRQHAMRPMLLVLLAITLIGGALDGLTRSWELLPLTILLAMVQGIVWYLAPTVYRAGVAVLMAHLILIVTTVPDFPLVRPIVVSVMFFLLPIVTNRWYGGAWASGMVIMQGVLLLLRLWLAGTDAAVISLFADVYSLCIGGMLLLLVVDTRVIATSVVQVVTARAAAEAAYEATLDGWSRAVDLRDHETAGHSQRVVAATMTLAAALHVATDDQVHLRRGALLHDIGKLGVPDAILRKTGPLTPDEWAIMRQHPIFARDMLRPIAFLAPAIPIPYGHHERWDGSGYPQGLAGSAIPFHARVFAVVDVYDALTSDRPYRPAWTHDRACAYLTDESGRLFDPVVVTAFLQTVAGTAPVPVAAPPLVV